MKDPYAKIFEVHTVKYFRAIDGKYMGGKQTSKGFEPINVISAGHHALIGYAALIGESDCNFGDI